MHTEAAVNVSRGGEGGIFGSCSVWEANGFA